MVTWKEVWDSRELPKSGAEKDADPLELALRLDGYDTAMAQGLTPASMRDLATGWRERVGFISGDSLYEVGCGAGAFLAAASAVTGTSQLGGSDYSSALIDSGRELFPWIDFEVCEASRVPIEPAYQHVACVGAFMYFNSLDYATEVLDRMTVKSQRTVSIFDVPDASRQERSEAFRRQGYSDSEYEQRYGGLDHLYFDRTWFPNQFDQSEWEVAVIDQDVAGYGNSKFRFNVFATKRLAD